MSLGSELQHGAQGNSQLAGGQGQRPSMADRGRRRHTCGARRFRHPKHVATDSHRPEHLYIQATPPPSAWPLIMNVSVRCSPCTSAGARRVSERRQAVTPVWRPGGARPSARERCQPGARAHAPALAPARRRSSPVRPPALLGVEGFEGSILPPSACSLNPSTSLGATHRHLRVPVRLQLLQQAAGAGGGGPGIVWAIEDAQVADGQVNADLAAVHHIRVCRQPRQGRSGWLGGGRGAAALQA